MVQHWLNAPKQRLMIDSKDWKIYTRKGDTGETSLIGGTRVQKNSLRIECYGTVDELNSVIGMLRDQKECSPFGKTLLSIQDKLFVAESLLAADSRAAAKALPHLKSADILFLEKEIDRMNEGLPVLEHFILPGGHSAVSWAHIARCVCRRAERLIIGLSQEAAVDALVIQYLNRLSDYLFVLSRRLSFDLAIPETIWPIQKPKPLAKKKAGRSR
jgi:cob(I)alamin adenosyltransferase